MCDAVCSVVYDVVSRLTVAQKLGCVCDVVFDVMRDGVCVIFVCDVLCNVVCDGVCCGGVVGKVK